MTAKEQIHLLPGMLIQSGSAWVSRNDQGFPSFVHSSENRQCIEGHEHGIQFLLHERVRFIAYETLIVQPAVFIQEDDIGCVESDDPTFHVVQDFLPDVIEVQGAGEGAGHVAAQRFRQRPLFTLRGFHLSALGDINPNAGDARRGASSVSAARCCSRR